MEAKKRKHFPFKAINDFCSHKRRFHNHKTYFYCGKEIFQDGLCEKHFKRLKEKEGKEGKEKE